MIEEIRDKPPCILYISLLDNSDDDDILKELKAENIYILDYKGEDIIDEYFKKPYIIEKLIKTICSEENGNIMIHCSYGYSRSPSFLMLFSILMTNEKTCNIKRLLEENRFDKILYLIWLSLNSYKY